MKQLVLIFGMVLFASVLFGQSAKMQEKAAEKATEINELIVSVDEDLALSEEQMTKITAVQLEKMTEVRKVKKGEADEEEKKEQVKAINKKYAKMINQEILTKDQRKAMQEAKKAAKE